MSHENGKFIRLNGYIPALCNETKDEYKNCETRHVNTINIDKVSDDKLEYLKEAITHDVNRDLLHDFKETIKYQGYEEELIANNKQNKIYYIEGFYNKLINYEKCTGEDDEDCGLNVGTVVNKHRAEEVFKEEYINSPELKRLEDPDGKKYIMVKGKGFGKKNLNIAANWVKSQGGEYIYLHAAGGEGLTKYYERMGFIHKIHNVGIITLEDGTIIRYPDPLLVGKVDNIIKETK